MQIPRSVVERYAHWLSYSELAHICAAPVSTEEHSRLCARVLMRSALATCLGQGIQLSVSHLESSGFGFGTAGVPAMPLHWWSCAGTVACESAVHGFRGSLGRGTLPYYQHATLRPRMGDLGRRRVPGPVTGALLVQDLKFQNNEHGKPLLDCNQLPRRARTLDFNLTNTGGLLAVAVAAGVRIGVDCERLDRSVSFGPERIAQRFFSPQEQAQLLSALLPALVHRSERDHWGGCGHTAAQCRLGRRRAPAALSSAMDSQRGTCKGHRDGPGGRAHAGILHPCAPFLCPGGRCRRHQAVRTPARARGPAPCVRGACGLAPMLGGHFVIIMGSNPSANVLPFFRLSGRLRNCALQCGRERRAAAQKSMWAAFRASAGEGPLLPS